MDTRYHELVKTQITVALGASADLTLRNVPNLTYEGESILTAISGPQFECDDGQTIAFEDANNGLKIVKMEVMNHEMTTATVY